MRLALGGDWAVDVPLRRWWWASFGAGAALALVLGLAAGPHRARTRAARWRRRDPRSLRARRRSLRCAAPSRLPARAGRDALIERRRWDEALAAQTSSCPRSRGRRRPPRRRSSPGSTTSSAGSGSSGAISRARVAAQGGAARAAGLRARRPAARRGPPQGGRAAGRAPRVGAGRGGPAARAAAARPHRAAAPRGGPAHPHDRALPERPRRAPDNLALAFGLGRVYFELAMLDEAAEQFEKMEVRAPDLPLIHAFLGAIFERRGQFRDAFEEYRRALRLSDSVQWPHRCGACGALHPRWVRTAARRAVAGTRPGPRPSPRRRRPLATVGGRPAGPRLPAVLPGVPGPPRRGPPRSALRRLLGPACPASGPRGAVAAVGRWRASRSRPVPRRPGPSPRARSAGPVAGSRPPSPTRGRRSGTRTWRARRCTPSSSAATGRWRPRWATC